MTGDNHMVRTVMARQAVVLSLTAAALAACDKDTPPTPPAPVQAKALPAPTTLTTAPPAVVTPVAAAQAPESVTEINAWQMKPRGAKVEPGGRAWVLTRGRDRTYTDPNAVYHLYAHDVVEATGNRVTIRELGGGSFRVPGLFVLPAGVPAETQLKKGDSVLAEWASSLKHAVVVGRVGERFKIRYTNLPESWSEDKISAVKDRRQLTLQQEGLQPGNFAVARIDGGEQQVLLLTEGDGRWLVRRFAGRVAAITTADLKALPLAPRLRRGQRVLAPWVGMMYPAVVRSVKGSRVTVSIEQIGRKEPIVTALGQVLPQMVADKP